MSRKGLGRGLGALIAEAGAGEGESVTEVPIKLIDANPNQPRKDFDSGKLEELAASMREHGVVQPIVLRPKGDRYEIVAGERRCRAARLAGLTKMPAVVRSFTEAEVMEIALIENLQREDLNPLEEAEAYRVLLDEFEMTQEELARRLGKSRPQVSNTLRLLNLVAEAQKAVRDGLLSMGHAKVLLGVESPILQKELAEVCGEKGWSVRELERAVEQRTRRRSQKGAGKRELTPEMRAVAVQLGEFFGTPVKIVPGEGKGKIEITYFGEEGLDRIVEALQEKQREDRRPSPGRFHV